jgi:hypothetical protein
MLKDLNLKMEILPPGPSALSNDAPLPYSAPRPPPGGRIAMTDELLDGNSSGLESAPFGLIALPTPNLPGLPEYNSDDDFCWDGNHDGLDYVGVEHKSKLHIAPYMPSCHHSCVFFSSSPASSPGGRTVNSTTTTCTSLLVLLLTALHVLCQSSVKCTRGGGLIVANYMRNRLHISRCFRFHFL